jgi:hypothetical protein
MLPIKHDKEPLGKALKVHSTTFSIQHLGLPVCPTYRQAGNKQDRKIVRVIKSKDNFHKYVF